MYDDPRITITLPYDATPEMIAHAIVTRTLLMDQLEEFRKAEEAAKKEMRKAQEPLTIKRYMTMPNFVKYQRCARKYNLGSRELDKSPFNALGQRYHDLAVKLDHDIITVEEIRELAVMRDELLLNEDEGVPEGEIDRWFVTHKEL